MRWMRALQLAAAALVALAACATAESGNEPSAAVLGGDHVVETDGPPTERAEGIEIHVDATAVGFDGIRYSAEVRNTTDRHIHVLDIEGAHPRIADAPDGGPGDLILTYRYGPGGRGGDEAPPVFDAVVVRAGQAVTMDSSVEIGLGSPPELITVCIGVEDILGNPDTVENGEPSQIIYGEPQQPIRLACSPPTRPVPLT
ncbi:MAG: hypothetical protein ACRD0K_03230 [Egibacteraceae bacterium]